jgi:hypothetical protein
MDCSMVLSSWGPDLGLLLDLFIIPPLLYFVDILMYSNFGKGFKSWIGHLHSFPFIPMFGGLMTQDGKLRF